MPEVVAGLLSSRLMQWEPPGSSWRKTGGSSVLFMSQLGRSGSSAMVEPTNLPSPNGTDQWPRPSTKSSLAIKTSLTLTASDDTEPMLLVQRELWMRQAMCHGMGHLFFSSAEDEDKPKSEPGRAERIARAKALCDACEVLDDCRDWSIRTQLRHGIAAGMTSNERRRYVKRQREVTSASCAQPLTEQS